MQPQPKSALITGITGQDGSYLAELLLDKGYTVHGTVRRHSTLSTQRIDHIYHDPAYNNRFFLHYGDMTDGAALSAILEKSAPDEVYNLAAQSHVAVSFEVPEYTAEATAVGTLRLLEAMRQRKSHAKFYQASTSELFGGLPESVPQNESTRFYPKSPYACAKLYAYYITVNYREAYGMFAANGILFNHESPRRGETFVTRKITMAVARIAKGSDECLVLGNLDAMRDWGYAGDYVEGMWRILQQENAGDYVLATGEMHSVREFARLAFAAAGIPVAFRGTGVDEVGYDERSGRILLRVSPRYFRKSEVEQLCGDPAYAERTLGWCRRVDFPSLVRMMVDADLKRTREVKDEAR